MKSTDIDPFTLSPYCVVGFVPGGTPNNFSSSSRITLLSVVVAGLRTLVTATCQHKQMTSPLFHDHGE